MTQAVKEAKPSTTSARILFVDDDKQIRSLVRRLLERARIPVELVECAEEAIARLHAAPQDYPVVVSDYCMPGMDGISFLEEAAAAAPLATRILISGNLEVPDVLRAVNQGPVFQILTKPWSSESLISLMRRAWERAHLMSHNARLLSELKQQNQELARLNEELDETSRRHALEMSEAILQTLALNYPELPQKRHRVAAYARRLAQQMECSEETINQVGYASLLAKIDTACAEPNSETVAQLLEEIETFKALAPTLRQQKAHFDGSGSPEGLSGSEISLEARIITVAEALEVMLCDRPFAESRSWDWAREEIRRCSGTLYDPQVVNALMAVGDEEWKGLARAP